MARGDFVVVLQISSSHPSFVACVHPCFSDGVGVPSEIDTCCPLPSPFFQLNLSNILFPARARKGPRSCQYCHNTMNKKLTLVTSYIFGSAEPLKESENETRSIRCDQSQDVHFLPSTRKSKQVQRRQLKLPRNYWRKSLCGGHAQPPSSWLPVHSLQHHCWWRN